MCGIIDLTFPHKQFKCMNEFRSGIDVVHGFGIEEYFFSVIAEDAEVEGGGAVVIGDKAFDTFELFTGNVMFVQVNAEAFSI